MLSTLRRMRAKRIERKQVAQLMRTIYRLGTGPNEDHSAKGLAEVALLVREHAESLKPAELKKISKLTVKVETLVREEDCAGYCNVAADSANPAPCFHPNGKIQTYDTITIDCAVIIDEAKREMQRRASGLPSYTSLRA